jgi:hypothetical protein
MLTNLLAVYRQMALTLADALPTDGAVFALRHQWLQSLPTASADTITELLPYMHRVHRFALPSAFLTLLREAPQPLHQPAMWALDAEPDTQDALVGCLALADSLCPPLWVGYAHPQWQWSPAGVGWLLWRGAMFNDQTSLNKAKTVYDWLCQKGYGHLLLENALHQLAPHVVPADALIPPAECPLSKTEWQEAQLLLPALKRGLIIAASDHPTNHPLFGAVAQQPNTPWTIVHTGWLWLLDMWANGDADTASDLASVNALLRQSIDTVVLHRMLTTDEVTV